MPELETVCSDQTKPIDTPEVVALKARIRELEGRSRPFRPTYEPSILAAHFEKWHAEQPWAPLYN